MKLIFSFYWGPWKESNVWCNKQNVCLMKSIYIIYIYFYLSIFESLPQELDCSSMGLSRSIILMWLLRFLPHCDYIFPSPSPLLGGEGGLMLWLFFYINKYNTFSFLSFVIYFCRNQKESCQVKQKVSNWNAVRKVQREGKTERQRAGSQKDGAGSSETKVRRWSWRKEAFVLHASRTIEKINPFVFSCSWSISSYFCFIFILLFYFIDTL